MYWLHFRGWHVQHNDLRAVELLAYGLSMAGRDWWITIDGPDKEHSQWAVGDPLPPSPLY